MVQQPFEQETLLDITVNLIPLAMLLFFFVLFTVVSPWGLQFSGPGSIRTYAMYGLLLFKITTLTAITYIGAKYISRDEP